MSRPTVCDSCGVHDEPAIKASRVVGVRLTVGIERSTPAQEILEADLCPTCQGLIAHQYFGVKARGGLEIPAFLNGGSA